MFIFNEIQKPFGSTKYIKWLRDSLIQYNTKTINLIQQKTQCDWGDSDVYNSSGEGEASSPATWPHPNSMEPVKKGQNNSITMGDHWKVIILHIEVHEVWVYCMCFLSCISSWQYPVHDRHISPTTRPTLTKQHFCYFYITESSQTLWFQNHYMHRYKQTQGREDSKRQRDRQSWEVCAHAHFVNEWAVDH